MKNGGKPTAREKLVHRKVLHVIAEFEFDLDSDIEGCGGDELTEIEYSLMACKLLKRRINSYLLGLVDNPRGCTNGELAMTKRPQVP